MDDLFARERATEEKVRTLLKLEDTPFKVLLAAFDEYRYVAQDAIFADFSNAETRESRLWVRHTETRQSLSRTLKNVRKSRETKTVEERIAIEMYLRFLKQSIRFYRWHIYKLSVAFGGIPELQAIAQQIKKDGVAGESPNTAVSAGLRRDALNSCHRSLVYLGDLCRYRASDNLDKAQDFGPAIGFYGLACAIRPESGWGHHQQAVIALEQKHHLRAIYHLYRSMLVAEPFKLAANNLKIEFDKSNVAWDKGELIEKGSPNDTDSGKKALIGWFVRLHSVCNKGELFRGYDELERELFGRLQRELRLRSLDANLMRMVFVNIGAQHNAMEKYTETQSPTNEQAFYYFMRINLSFFTTLLELLLDDLANIAQDPDFVEVELADKLLPVMSRVLPGLRLYSFWLLLNSHIVLGLGQTEFLAPSVEKFWHAFARTMDLVMATFPIWDLEDSPQVTYMLEEDTEALAFRPFVDPTGGLTNKLWYETGSETLKPRFSDQGITHLDEKEELLARILNFLEVGSHLATHVDHAPIKIQGPRFVLGDSEPFILPAPPPQTKATTEVKQPQKPKPLTYAAVATIAQPKAGKVPQVPSVPTKNANTRPPKKDAQQQVQRDVQLSRMVDDLVDDEDENNPVTPPQQFALNPAVVGGNGDITPTDVPHLSNGASKGFSVAPNVSASLEAPGSHQSGRNIPVTPSESVFNPSPGLTGGKLGTASSLWPSSPASANKALPAPSSPGVIGSPPHGMHQRGGSTNSIRSVGSKGLGDSWSSLDSGSRPKQLRDGSFGNGAPGLSAATSVNRSKVLEGVPDSPAQHGGSKGASPLLFGAGSSVWSVLSKPGPNVEFG